MADQNFKVKNGITFTPVDLTTLTNAAAGDIAVDINDSNKLKRYNSVTSAWVEVGSASSGVGDLSTLQADTAETNTLADYTQTGLEILTTVGGATANQLIHGTATYRLIHQAASTYSFKRVIAVDEKFRNRALTITIWNRSTATSGNDTLLVTDETNATTLLASSSIQTDSAAFSVTTVSASPTITMATNSDYNSVTQGCSITGPGIPTGSIITAKGANNQITISNNATAGATVTARVSGLPTARTFSFTTGATTASLSWTISSLQEANSPESYFDDIQISIASTVQSSAAVTYNVTTDTEWQAAPIFPIASVGTVTNGSYWFKQNGDEMMVKIDFTAGTPVASVMSVALPSGYAIDPAKLPSNVSGTSVGRATQITAGSNTNYAVTSEVFYDGSDTTKVYLSNTLNTSKFIKINGDGFVGTGVPATITFSVPILGWKATKSVTQNIPLTSSVLVTEPDTSFRITDFTPAKASTATAIYTLTSGTITQNVGNGIQYLDDAVNGARFIATKEAVYNFSLTVELGSGVQGIGFSLNASSLTTTLTGLPSVQKLAVTYDGGSSSVPTVSSSVLLKVGDVVRVHGEVATLTSPGGGYCTFAVSSVGKTKILNPSSDQKIAIPTHELRFESSTTRGSTDTQVVKFDNMTKIIGDGLTFINTSANGTVVTAQKAGLLSVSTGLYAGPGSAAMQITRNSASLVTFGVSSGEVIGYGGHVGSNAGGATCSSIPVVKGDVIRVMLNVVPVANGTANFVEFTLTESSVAVALSNVTPQFVDGGSFLELQQANGFGSTATSVRRFSTLLNSLNNGQDFTYVDSSTLGAQITIKTPDFYSITFCDSGSGPTDVYVMVNSIPRAISTTASASYRAEAVFSGYLNANDVVTFVNSAQTTGTTSAQTRMTIARIGKPSIAAVDVTPFVNLKGQETQNLRLKGTNGYGSTATFTRRFTTVEENTNNGIFRYSDDSVDGTTVTFLKKANVRIVYSDGFSGASASQGISRNAANGNTDVTSLPVGNVVGFTYSNSTSNNMAAIYIGTAEAGDVFRAILNPGQAGGVRGVFTVEAVADSTSVVSAAKTYRMSDYLVSGTRVTGVDPANLGEYRTMYRATASNQTLSDCTSVATPPSTANGVFIRGDVNYAIAGTASIPQYYKIFIGKNKQYSVQWSSTTGRTGLLSTDYFIGQSVAESGALNRYDPTTGILEVDAAYNFGTFTSRYLGNVVGGGAALNGYFDVTVFESPFVSVTLPAKVYLQYTGNASNAITANVTNIPWSNKVVDSHGAWNGTTFTPPRPDWYDFKGLELATATNTTAIEMYVNGTRVLGVDAQGSSATHSFNVGRYLLTTDLVTFRQSGAVTLSNDAFYHWISITSQG